MALQMPGQIIQQAIHQIFISQSAGLTPTQPIQKGMAERIG